MSTFISQTSKSAPQVIGLAFREIFSHLKDQQWDVIGCQATNSYNATVLRTKKPLNLLPSNKTILCVGNSNAVWPKIQTLLKEGATDPFDRLSVASASNCANLASVAGLPTQALLSHLPDPFLVSFQMLAVDTGIGRFHEGTQLVIHPKFGPWIALRFALVMDCEWNNETLQCLTDAAQAVYGNTRSDDEGTWTASPTHSSNTQPAVVYSCNGVYISTVNNGGHESGNKKEEAAASATSKAPTADSATTLSATLVENVPVLPVVHADEGDHDFDTQEAQFQEDAAKATDVMTGQAYSPYIHIAARRAFRLGEKYAYSDEQLRYHYHIGCQFSPSELQALVGKIHKEPHEE